MIASLIWPLQGGMICVQMRPKVEGMGRLSWNVVTLQVDVFQVGPPFGLALVHSIQGLVRREAV